LPAFSSISPYSWPNALVAIYAVSLGAFVLFSDPKAEKNRLCFLLTLATSVWLSGYAVVYSLTDPSKIYFFCKMGHTAATYVTPIFYYFLLAVLKNYAQPADRYIAHGALLFAVVGSSFIHFSDAYIQGATKYFWGHYPNGGPLMLLFAVWTVVLVFRAIYLFWKASVKARNDLRNDDYQRFKYHAISLSIFGLAAVDYLAKFDIEVYPFGYVFVAAFTTLTAYAIVKHKLLDINIAIKRGFVYSILAALIAFFYFFIALISEHFFRSYFGYRSLFTAFFASLVIALIFNPLRDRLQSFIDRQFFKIDPETIIKENSQMRAALQNQDKMNAIANLAAGVAHEIKNPLTAIKTFTEYLPERVHDPEFIQKFHTVVGAEVTKIDEIVKQLLDFSKPSQPMRRKIDACALSDDLLNLLNNELMKKKNQCDTRLFRSYLHERG